jgi:hypothetical protein
MLGLEHFNKLINQFNPSFVEHSIPKQQNIYTLQTHMEHAG